MAEARTIPTIRPESRRGGIGPWLIVSGALVAVGVVISLLVSGVKDGHTTVPITEATPVLAPRADAAAPAPGAADATAPAPATPAPAAQPPTPAPAPHPPLRVHRCDPIIGVGSANSGVTYPVISSARGRRPAGCEDARTILLAALNAGDSGVGEWRCTRSLNEETLATCAASGGRRILARE
jgi:pyruvate/2-oxoglutarate dehydrogenase complex dihydrolipoamide acyltransferase (E2) component